MSNLNQPVALVTGAGGFIGSHLVKYLKQQGYLVYGIDLHQPQFSVTVADKFLLLDLSDSDQVQSLVQQLQSGPTVGELYMLAADMGGIAYITQVAADLMRQNLRINLNCLELARQLHIKKVFFASSACVYPETKQDQLQAQSLKETDALPAQPDTFYGWEKLMTEQLCQAYRLDYGLDVRIARFHNIYGPEGTFEGGREKSPAAICRKVALAKEKDKIEVWGDGQQERSYCYIDDCCQAVYQLMQSNCQKTLNIGSDEKVSIDQLVDLVATIAKKKISKQHLLDQPQGVRSRNADISLIEKELAWQPQTSLRQGLTQTYQWIAKQVNSSKK